MDTKLIKLTLSAIGAAIGFFSPAFAQTPPQQVQTEATAASIIVRPAADVPASCASFSGEWTGIWRGGIGQQWLWVAEVDPKCTAKVAYLQNSKPPEGFRTAGIKDGALSIGCGGAGNTCIFTRHGDSLWVTYSGSQGSNNAVFERIQ